MKRTAIVKNDPDRPLVERLKRGDKTAFNQLYAKYRDKFVALLCAKRDFKNEVAEEVVQTALMKAYAQIRTFNGDSLFSGWLWKVTENAAEDAKEAEQKAKGGASRKQVKSEYPNQPGSNCPAPRAIWSKEFFSDGRRGDVDSDVDAEDPLWRGEGLRPRPLTELKIPSKESFASVKDSTGATVDKITTETPSSSETLAEENPEQILSAEQPATTQSTSRPNCKISFWMGRKPLRLSLLGPMQRKRWDDHDVDPEAIRIELGLLREAIRQRRATLTETQWASLAERFADYVAILRPEKRRWSRQDLAGYWLLTACDAYHTSKGRALFLAGMLAGLLPAPMGRRPAATSSWDERLDYVLGV